MRASWNWLRELVDVQADVDDVVKRLTLAGLEIEAIERIGEDFTGVVVAEVLAKKPHPNADKLTLVTVEAGAGPIEVVCGAPNVPAPGGKVLWARPGARLPGDREIGARDVRGVRSAGMICSETELGIGEEGDGIVVLGGEDAQAAVGAIAQDALGLRDVALEVNVTANRPDCLGLLGLAREIAALCHGTLRRPEVSLDGLLGDRDVASLARVDIEDPVACPRYLARVIEGLTVGPSPRWLRRRLEVVGVRPISNLVDVTNYVLFELGQPLHAFDYDKLGGGHIIVRRARPGERMKTLDGQDRALEPGDVVIADPRGAVALAGVMGGLETEVSSTTTRVLLESATFDPPSVRRTAKRLGLHSEASHRFERGVDANGVDFASARASRLLAQLGGGRVARGAADTYPTKVAPRVLELRPSRVERLLGIPVETSDITRYLHALECQVEPAPGAADGRLRVTAPTFRPDLDREIDLIEEVARLHGFDKVPATLPVSEVAPSSSGDALGPIVRRALSAAGLDEAITFGFTSTQRIAALRFPPDHPVMRPILVANPMREEQAAMRTSLLPNLLAALARNASFGVTDVRLFELGSVVLPSGKTLPDEPRFVAGVLAGTRPGWLKCSARERAGRWKGVAEGDGGPLDFYDARGAVERLFEALRLPISFVPARSEDGFLHPGVAAAILVGDDRVGVVGEVHPETRDRLGIERVCFAFEINLDRLPALSAVKFQPIPRFPAIVRDVSFFVAEETPAQRVRDLVRAERPEFLEDVRVLEDYREPGRVPEGKKGMLWSLTYRAPDRTLTDAEVDAIHEALVGRLLRALQAQRR